MAKAEFHGIKRVEAHNTKLAAENASIKATGVAAPTCRAFDRIGYKMLAYPEVPNKNLFVG